MIRGEVGAAALALIVLATAVCSEWVTSPPPSTERVRVVYWEKWTGFEYEGIKSIVDDFNASQDRIEVVLLTVSNLSDKALMSISGGVPPDVAGLWGTNVAQYADNGALMPLDSLCAEYGITRDRYIEAYWEIGYYDGHVYALPSTPASTALHYNTAMFREAGFEGPPETLEELVEVADKLTVRNPDGSIHRAGFLPSEPGWWNWGWGYMFGGSLWDGRDRLTINSPENIEAFEWVQSFSEKYGPGEIQTFRSGFGNFSSPQNAFLSEKVSMVLQGVWMSNFIDMYNPGLAWDAAAFPYPAGRPELANVNFVDMDTLVIPVGAQHPREAFEFIAYVQSQAAMEKLCLSHRKNSPLREISEEFWAQHGNPAIRLFDQMARSPNAIAPPKVGIWPELSNEMSNAYDKVVLMQADPVDALAAVEKRMQPRFNQYRERLAKRKAIYGDFVAEVLR